MNFIEGRDNLACTIFVPVICGNNCSFCNTKKDYDGFVYDEKYLTKILNKMIFIGACALIIVAIIPIICSGLFGANVSFGGTSLIIIVGVVIETIRQVESQIVVRDYKGFLND